MNDIATKLRAAIFEMEREHWNWKSAASTDAKRGAHNGLVQVLAALTTAAPQAEQRAGQAPAVEAEPCAICGEGRALLMRCCSNCGSEYAGAAEMMENYRAPAVAHGHKVTPYEPTQEMIGAVKRFDPALPLEHIRAIWWAMWGASKPPVQGGQS